MSRHRYIETEHNSKLEQFHNELGNDVKFFESDIMENSEYKSWIELYPNYSNEIFETLISYGAYEYITVDDILYFVNEHKIDLNEDRPYNSDNLSTTPLGHACEFRKKELIKCLLDASSCLYGYKKINGNLRDNSGCLPLELLLWGHGSYNTINKSNSLIITKIIDLMKPYGLEMKIKKYIYDYVFNDKNLDKRSLKLSEEIDLYN